MKIRLAVLSIVFSVPLAAQDVTPAEPLPTLPPNADTVLTLPGDEERPTTVDTERSIDRLDLVADLAALRKDVDRVRRSLEQSGLDLDEVLESNSMSGTNLAPLSEDLGEVVLDREDTSPRLGSNVLKVFHYLSGDRPLEPRITAAIDSERVEVVYRELMYLLGRNLDDNQVPSSRRVVDLHVEDMSWPESLNRLLGQVGLDWISDGEGRGSTIVIFEAGKRPRGTEHWEDRASYALRQAAREADDLIAAQARFLLARRDQQRAFAENRRELHFAAINAFADLVRDFDTGLQRHRGAQTWVRHGMLGIGNSMEALGLHQEAFSVYRNFIAKADQDDPEVPVAMLAAAKAARLRYAGDGTETGEKGTGDLADLNRATDMLNLLITRFGNHPDAAVSVTEGRLELGQLLFDSGDYVGAKEELLAHVEEVGAQVGHRIQMQLAESDYALGRRARLDGNQELAEVHLHNAAARLEGLLVELDGGEGDPLVDPDLYRQAMFRLGEIAMLRRRPDYVDALHRFLRARQRFPDSPIEGQLLVKIARCYAEIEADEQHVATLWNILGDERFIDNRDVGFQLEELLADLTDHVDDYPGPIEIRTMFYIAQYHWRAAQRDPATREQHLKEALSKYQRVLGEGPPMRLAQSARLGLSRAALMLGDETRAVQTLKTILRDPGTHPRDAELAAQLLGDHYYEQGRYRQAIQAYDGDVSQ